MLAILAALSLGQTPTPPPLETRVLKLRNAAAADVAAAIKTSSSGNQFAIAPELVSNSLLISATAADMARFVEQINKLDAPLPTYCFDIRVCTGDPLGSKAAGTLKVLAEPKVMTTESRPGFIRAGGTAEIDGEVVATGPEVKVAVLSVDGEKLRVRVEAAHTTIEGDEPQRSVKTIKSVATRTVRDGEAIRLRVGQTADETWVEVRVHSVCAQSK